MNSQVLRNSWFPLNSLILFLFIAARGWLVYQFLLASSRVEDSDEQLKWGSSYSSHPFSSPNYLICILRGSKVGVVARFVCSLCWVGKLTKAQEREVCGFLPTKQIRKVTSQESNGLPYSILFRLSEVDTFLFLIRDRPPKLNIFIHTNSSSHSALRRASFSIIHCNYLINHCFLPPKLS